jgi:hypothetical protein
MISRLRATLRFKSLLAHPSFAPFTATINQMAERIMEIAGTKLSIRHIPGPLGVRGRNSDNHLIRQELGWAPSQPLRVGLTQTYTWIEGQVKGEAAFALKGAAN